jgi:hypothetical protein
LTPLSNKQQLGGTAAMSRLEDFISPLQPPGGARGLHKESRPDGGLRRGLAWGAWAAGLGMALSSLLVVLNALRLSGKTPLQALS